MKTFLLSASNAILRNWDLKIVHNAIAGKSESLTWFFSYYYYYSEFNLQLHIEHTVNSMTIYGYGIEKTKRSCSWISDTYAIKATHGIWLIRLYCIVSAKKLRMVFISFFKFSLHSEYWQCLHSGTNKFLKYIQKLNPNRSIHLFNCWTSIGLILALWSHKTKSDFQRICFSKINWLTLSINGISAGGSLLNAFPDSNHLTKQSRIGNDFDASSRSCWHIYALANNCFNRLLDTLYGQFFFLSSSKMLLSSEKKFFCYP